MGFPFETLRPHLEAVAYLAEIVIAEGLFLMHFEQREHRRLPAWVGLAFMFLVGAITGIPSGSSLIRFAWYFALMAWRILCALYCLRGSPSSVVSACMAGFATQHIANKTVLLLRLIPPVGAATEQISALGVLLEVVVVAGVYALIRGVFAQHIHPKQDNLHLNLLSAAITLLCIGVNRLVVDNAGESVQYEAAVCIYAIISCVFALIILVYISRWEEERSQALIMRLLLADSEKQYGQWKANVEQVNIIVHDIKHMLTRVQALAEKKHVELPDLDAIRETVDGFSPAIRTGNDVLDILLRNMTDLCRQNDIILNCTAYTDHLKHLDGMILYFLFANAIDNAIESVALVTELDKRLIDVSIRRFGNSVVIHIWNYYTGKLDLVDGLPITHGSDQMHGFGMKSIQLIVERLGGALSVRAEGEVFNLDVMLPLREAEPDTSV